MSNQPKFKFPCEQCQFNHKVLKFNDDGGIDAEYSRNFMSFSLDEAMCKDLLKMKTLLELMNTADDIQTDVKCALFREKEGKK